MGFLRDFARGFLAIIVAILVLDIITVVVLGHTWMTLLFALVLLIPLSIVAYEYSKCRKSRREKVSSTERLKQILVSLYGVSFACWMFDVGTTYYAVDVLGVAAEQNPLGWPIGAVGALIFYVPTFIFTYLLLFRFKQRYSILAAVLLTASALWLGAMNLIAGFQNAGCCSSYPSSISIEFYSHLFVVFIAMGSIYAVVFIKLTKLTWPQRLMVKPSLSVVAMMLSSLALITALSPLAYNFFTSNSKQEEGKPSFELSNFYVGYTYTYIGIRNNGTATAYNVFVTFYFLRPLDSNYQWATIKCIPEIREDRSAILTIPVGRYHLESTYPGTDATDYAAHVAVFCVHEQSEIHVDLHLEDFQVLPSPDT